MEEIYPKTLYCSKNYGFAAVARPPATSRRRLGRGSEREETFE
jgi:hypothetical protein